jgi:kynurenine formamidase
MAQRIVDLSYLIHEGMTTYPSPNHPRVEITQLGRHGIENRETRKVVLGTHTGTHCDAQRHFVAQGSTIEHAPLEVLIGPARLLDLTSVGAKQPVDAALLKMKLGTEVEERLVLRYDWPSRWGSISYYRDHPFLTVEAAEWIVANGIRLLGMDTPSPDNPRDDAASDNDSPVHKILLGHGVTLVEYLCNLEQIRRDRFELVALPLKIKDGDGAPARCVGLLDEEI